MGGRTASPVGGKISWRLLDRYNIYLQGLMIAMDICLCLFDLALLHVMEIDWVDKI